VTVGVCSECGHRNVLRSRFEAQCTECGSEDLEPEDAYDPAERELRCQECGYEVDTSSRDQDWDEEDKQLAQPASVDDPCPICGEALVPAADLISVGSLPEYKLAREAARKLHREHTLPGPPYQPRHLGEQLGLQVLIGEFRHDGMLVGNTIEIPGGAAVAAQRFAIAHEIGHHILRHDGDRTKVEPEANAFASELLVPRADLMAAIARNSSVTALRERFGVSREAMVYALRAAGAINKATR
jgi:ribosomal protein S27E